MLWIPNEWKWVMNVQNQNSNDSWKHSKQIIQVWNHFAVGHDYDYLITNFGIQIYFSSDYLITKCIYAFDGMKRKDD